MEEAEKDNYSWFASYVDVLLFYKKKLELVRFAEKSWLKVLFTNLLWEKNTVSAKKNKLKSKNYKTNEQDQESR
jgi:hypothetical protein